MTSLWRGGLATCIFIKFSISVDLWNCYYARHLKIIYAKPVCGFVHLHSNFSLHTVQNAWHVCCISCYFFYSHALCSITKKVMIFNNMYIAKRVAKSGNCKQVCSLQHKFLWILLLHELVFAGFAWVEHCTFHNSNNN